MSGISFSSLTPSIVENWSGLFRAERAISRCALEISGVGDPLALRNVQRVCQPDRLCRLGFGSGRRMLFGCLSGSAEERSSRGLTSAARARTACPPMPYLFSGSAQQQVVCAGAGHGATLRRKRRCRPWVWIQTLRNGSTRTALVRYGAATSARRGLVGLCAQTYRPGAATPKQLPLCVLR